MTTELSPILAPSALGYYRSVDIAAAINRTHKNFLRDVRAYLDANPETPVNEFKPDTYIDERNRSKPMVLISASGLLKLIVAMRLPKMQTLATALEHGMTVAALNKIHRETSYNDMPTPALLADVMRNSAEKTNRLWESLKQEQGRVAELRSYLADRDKELAACNLEIGALRAELAAYKSQQPRC